MPLPWALLCRSPTLRNHLVKEEGRKVIECPTAASASSQNPARAQGLFHGKVAKSGGPASGHRDEVQAFSPLSPRALQGSKDWCLTACQPSGTARSLPSLPATQAHWPACPSVVVPMEGPLGQCVTGLSTGILGAARGVGSWCSGSGEPPTCEPAHDPFLLSTPAILSLTCPRSRVTSCLSYILTRQTSDGTWRSGLCCHLLTPALSNGKPAAPEACETPPCLLHP